MQLADSMDIIQTASIIFTDIVLVYVVIRLERALGASSEKLRSALANQKETLNSLNIVWKRINEIEARVGMKSDQIFPEELRTTLAQIQQRLDEIESRKNGRW